MSRGALALTLTLAVGLSACGSSSTKTTTSAPLGSAATVPATPGTATTLASLPTVSPAPGGNPNTVADGPVPAVTGATDLTKEPGVAAGTPPPPTALTGKDLVIGQGEAASVTSTVKVQYVGAFYNTGKVFDASWTDGSGPASFPLNGVIPGFGDAITGMKIGGRREVVIPPALGYGANGKPPTIPPNATLVFVIDLLGVS